MSDIKKCPFCGSERLEDVFDGDFAWVVCHDCKAEGPLTESNDEGVAVIKAIRLWNKAKR